MEIVAEKKAGYNLLAFICLKMGIAFEGKPYGESGARQAASIYCP